MILKIINNLKYLVNKKIFLKKYGLGEQEIFIKDDVINLILGKKYRSEIPISRIVDIIYNIDEDGYYFRIKTAKERCEQFFFDRKYDTRYRVKNIKNFIDKIKDLNIKIIPDFGQYGAIYECQYDGIIQHCLVNKKFLLTITVEKDSNYIFYLNYGDFNRFNYKITFFDNLHISKELKNNSININTKMHNSSLGFYILDKSLTFNRGYCLTSVDLTGCNNSPQVFGDDIFYSFDEEEIKNKIIELFEKYNCNFK